MIAHFGGSLAKSLPQEGSEALSLQFQATAHGAWMSGQAVASRIIAESLAA